MGDRLLELAGLLAERDRDVPGGLERARAGIETLREVALAGVDRFGAEVRAQGAAHLANLEVGPVEADDKHVDCLQCRIRRGRFEAILVAKASGKVTLVGPFKRGKTEKPCADHALEGAEVESGVEDLLVRLIEQASER